MSSRDLVVAAAGASAPSDPNFKNVSLLLSGDGTNGAQNNTFLDSSTNNFTITRNGNTTQGTFSPYGNLWSNYFDGSGDYLTAPSSSAFDMWASDATAECWVNFNSLANVPHLLVIGPSEVSRVTLYMSSSKLKVFIYPSDVITSTTTFIVGTWYHVALTRQSGTWKLWINGVLEGTSTAGYPSGNASVGIGFQHFGGASGDYLNGYLSQVRLVKGTAVYTSAFTPSTTPLTAVSGTSLLTCQSNRFIDNSSNNFTLTVNGNTSVQRFSPFNPTAPYSPSVNGGSGYFDGTGDYLTIPDNAALQMGSGNFTIEFFVNFNSVSGFQTVLDKGFTSSGGILFQTNQATMVAYISGTFISSNTSIVARTWNHIALVRNGSTITLYQNGNSVGTLTSSVNINNASTLSIGANASGGNDPLSGYVSNVRMVKGTALYTSNFTPPTAPLTAITNTSLLCNFTNAGIPDAAMMNDLETVGNAQVSTSVKKYGTGSLYFDGTGDYLTMPISPNLLFNTGDFTVEAWVYSTSGSASQFIWATHNSGTVSGWYMMLSGGKLDWGSYGNGSNSDVASSASYPVNQWFHAAVTKSNGTLRLFINGNQEYSGSDSANNYATAPYPFTVGADQDGTHPFFGYIDGLRITKGLARYTANFTPPAQALPTQ